jgi:hypothetical protein
VDEVADVEEAQAGDDERAGDDLRVDAARDVAVVRRVALNRLEAPGSPEAAWCSAGWLTCRRRLATTRGWVSSAMSMIRAAPTSSGLPDPRADAAYSSNSST